MEEVYRPLRAAGARLVAMVSTYLRTAHSVDAAARRWFVHPNTVRYRLRRAAEACSRTAGDPRDAQVLCRSHWPSAAAPTDDPPGL